MNLLGVLSLFALGWAPGMEWLQPLALTPPERGVLMELRVSESSSPEFKAAIEAARLDWCQAGGPELCIPIKYVPVVQSNVLAAPWLDEPESTLDGFIDWPGGALLPPVLFINSALEDEEDTAHLRHVARHEIAHGLGGIIGHPQNQGVLDSHPDYGTDPGQTLYLITDDDVRTVTWFRRQALERKAKK